MQEPVDIRQRKKKAIGSLSPDAADRAVPRSDIFEESIEYLAEDNLIEDKARQQGSSIDDTNADSKSSNDISTIVISDSDDGQLNNAHNEELDSHQIKLRSKIAQQLWTEQSQHQQQLQQQQQRRHRAKHSRNQITGVKVNNQPLNRLKRSSVKKNNQGNLVERLSTASDLDGDIDNSDNGYEEEDKDSDDDRDQDVRDIYNQGISAIEPDNVYNNTITGATEEGPNAFFRVDRLKQDRSSSLRLRTRLTARTNNRSKRDFEDIPKTKIDGDNDSGDGNHPFACSNFEGFGVDSNTDHNNNSRHFINRNNRHISPESARRQNKLRHASHLLETSCECSDCSPKSKVFSGTLSRVLNFIRGDNSASTQISSCRHKSGSTASGKSSTDKIRRCNKASRVKSSLSNIDKVNEWQDQQEFLESTSGKRKRDNMPSANGSNYQSLAGPSSRKSFKSGKHREVFNLYDKNGYTKLGGSYQQRPTPESSLLHELKRVLLLLLIIAVCGLVLWQIYQVLIEEDNYLGVVKYSPSELGKFRHYAVSTDAAPCSKIGKDLLAKGGHAVDAAIGTLLCMGVVLPNSLGLGGGCLITIYDNKTKIGTVIDGRETAPDYATGDMFTKNALLASRGPLSIGVPGELAAYWEAHQRFGRLKWSELFNDTIELAETGFETVEHLSSALRDLNHAKYLTPPLAKILTSNATNEYYIEGEIMYQRGLAQTLKRIRDNGVAEFYNGTTGEKFINDLQKQGGRMTMDNLRSYKALVSNAVEFKLGGDLKVLTQPMPGSGVVLGIILRIMHELGYYKNLKPKSDFDSATLYYHHLVEAFKFAYAQRAALEDNPDDPKRLETLLAKITSDEFIKDAASKITNDKTHPSAYYGGLEYYQEDHGTAHVSVIDDEGNSVAVSTSINLYFGSGLVSPSTGIIYNDVMDDFVSPNLTNMFLLPPSRYNRIRPGRRPMSSMTPSVFVDGKGNPKLIVGASGGSKITTATAMVVMRNLFFEEDIKTAIDSSRIHHQYLPDQIMFEANFPPEILGSLVDRGHKLNVITGRSSVVMAIACDYKNTSKFITANSDYRKGGTVAGL